MCLARFDVKATLDLQPAMIGYKIVRKLNRYHVALSKKEFFSLTPDSVFDAQYIPVQLYTGKFIDVAQVPLGCGWSARDGSGAINANTFQYPAGVHAYINVNDAGHVRRMDFSSYDTVIVKVLLRGPIVAGYESYCGVISPVVVYKDMIILAELLDGDGTWKEYGSERK